MIFFYICKKKMMKHRKMQAIRKSSVVLEGAGVKVNRVISNRDVYEFDPFLLLDVFDSTDYSEYEKGFPWHPHRGIETVTYLITGKIEHGDSIGNSGTITDGCCQWMTAGSGIIHQEMPQKTERIKGWQLWINLPAKDKFTKPQYRDIQASKVPVVDNNGVSVKIISGSYAGVEGAMQADYVKTRILDIAIDKEQSFHFETLPENNLFAYIMDGEVKISDENEVYASGFGLLFSSGEKLVLKAGKNSARIMIFEAKPLKEPIAWGGPIVMNASEELETAFREIREGDFIK